jgi:hypothetical protein
LKTDTYSFISPSVLLGIRNVSDKSCRENQNAQFILKNNVKKYGRARQSADGNVTRRRKDAICVPYT